MTGAKKKSFSWSHLRIYREMSLVKNQGENGIQSVSYGP